MVEKSIRQRTIKQNRSFRTIKVPHFPTHPHKHIPATNFTHTHDQNRYKPDSIFILYIYYILCMCAILCTTCDNWQEPVLIKLVDRARCNGHSAAKGHRCRTIALRSAKPVSFPTVMSWRWVSEILDKGVGSETGHFFNLLYLNPFYIASKPVLAYGNWTHMHFLCGTLYTNCTHLFFFIFRLIYYKYTCNVHLFELLK